MSDTPKRGLGRGLGALIPTAAAPTAMPDSVPASKRSVAARPEPQVESVHGLTYAELDINAIVPNPRQPRLHRYPASG